MVSFARVGRVNVSEWEPATDAEVAMRDALRTDDQESYFRILAGVDLLLPVSADALAGLAPLGWGTWSTGGRTHVLAFTSPAALQACLADYTGSARRVAYAELADTWPNLEWWLAVNPGLPIEGYLPAWFVAQLSRGDLRLPTRGPARDGGKPVASQQDLQAAAMAANAAASGEPGGPMPRRWPMPSGGWSRGQRLRTRRRNPGAGVRPAAAYGDGRSSREQTPGSGGYAAAGPGGSGAAGPGYPPAAPAVRAAAGSGIRRRSGPATRRPLPVAGQVRPGRADMPAIDPILGRSAPVGCRSGPPGRSSRAGSRRASRPLRRAATASAGSPASPPAAAPARIRPATRLRPARASRRIVAPASRSVAHRRPSDAPVSGGAAVPSAYRPPDLPGRTAAPACSQRPVGPAGRPGPARWPVEPSGRPARPTQRPPSHRRRVARRRLRHRAPAARRRRSVRPTVGAGPQRPLPTRTPMAQTPPLPAT